MAVLPIVMLARLVSAPAMAQAPHIDAGVYTDVPTSVGVRGTVELDNRVRLSLGGGFFPNGYLSVINGVATSAGWYGEGMATLIDAALSQAFLVRPQVGYRPWEDRGYYVNGGYQRVFAVGGEASSSEVADGTGGVDDGTAYNLKSSLHMLTIEGGHEWLVKERLVIRASVGGAFTLSAQTTASQAASSDAPFERAREVGREVLEELLDETYTSYVHTPTVGVEVGWRFR